MLRRLLALSLVTVAWYEVFLYFLIPGRSFPVFQDMRITKDFIALAFSLTIGLFVLSKHGFKPMKDFWLSAFLIFLVWNLFKIPNANILIGPVNVNGLWNGYPAFQVLAYFVLFLGISSAPELIRKREIGLIVKTVSLSGILMAGYVILQSFRLDQIMSTVPTFAWDATAQRHVAGTLGQPTLCAPFLIMTLPFTLELKRWWFAGLTMIGVVLSGSAVALISLFVVFTIWMIITSKFYDIKRVFMLVIFILCVVGVVYGMRYGFFSDNGRFAVWAQAWKDLASAKSSLTGMGIGSFKFLFGVKNGNGWYQAHNEYLQAIWSFGIIGTAILAMFLSGVFQRILNHFEDRNVQVFSLGLFAVMLCAGGTFVFQLAAYQFYSVVFLGMIYNLTREVQNARANG